MNTVRLTRLRDRLAHALFDELDERSTLRPGTRRTQRRWRAPSTSGNLNVSFGNVDGEALLLAMGNLAVSSGAACTSTDPEPKPRAAGLGLSEDAARSSLRFGLGRFNTDADVELAAERVDSSLSVNYANWPPRRLAKSGRLNGRNRSPASRLARR